MNTYKKTRKFIIDSYEQEIKFVSNSIKTARYNM